MATTESIPIATYGGNETVAKELSKLLLPEYDVVHVCLKLSHALAELPSLCNRDVNVAAASPLGSNQARRDDDILGRRVPVAVVFGGGVADDEYEAVAAAIEARLKEEAGRGDGAQQPVKMVRVTRADVLAAGGTGPEPGVVARVVRSKLQAEGLKPGAAAGEAAH
ncbi:hypothetical protein VTK26DRAFT_1278 [Humicola hyalothermophila]